MGIREKVVSGLRKVGKAITLENVRRGIGYADTALGVARTLQGVSHPGISRNAKRVPIEDLENILGVAKKVHTIVDRANRAPGLGDPQYHLNEPRIHVLNPTRRVSVFDEDKMARSIVNNIH
jgi:hypothetical protein